MALYSKHKADYLNEVAAHNITKTRALSEQTLGDLRRLSVDAEGLDAYPDDLADLIASYADPTQLLYHYTYRLKMSATAIPENAFKAARFFYHYQPDWTGATSMFDVPIEASIVDCLYLTQRRNAASELRNSIISDVPTSWRNMTGAYRFVFERIGATAAQQLGIIAGMEREIIAGLSSAYTSTSTATRYIDFQSTSAGANDPILQTALVAAGWTIINANQVEKMISSNGATARRWRVLHN